MKLKTIVDQLIEKGHDIQYSRRKDGGILVRFFDGTKYTGAEGNKKVREVAGVKLSKRKQDQLTSIRPPKLTPIPKTLRNQVARINRRLSRMSRRTRVEQGRISMKDIRKQLDQYGMRGLQRKLFRRENYLKGIAYPENTMLLLSRLRRNISKCKNKSVITELNRLYNKIAMNINTFRDEYIYPSYEVMYAFEQSKINEEELLRQLKSVIPF